MNPSLQLYYIRKNSIKFSSFIIDFIQKNKQVNNLLAVAWITEKVKESLPVFLEIRIDITEFSKNFKKYSKNESELSKLIEEKCEVKALKPDKDDKNDKNDDNHIYLSDEVKEVLKLNEMNHVNSGFVLNLIIFHPEKDLGELYSTIQHIRIDAEGPLIHYVSPSAYPKSRDDRLKFIEDLKKKLGEEHFERLYKQFKKEFREYRNMNKGTKILTLVEKDYGTDFKKGHIVSVNLLESQG